MAESSFAPRSMKRKNVKGLALTPAAPKPSGGESGNPQQQQQKPGGWGAGGSRAAEGTQEQLEIGIEFSLDLRQEDLEVVKELGAGNGGTVSKVKHITTGTIMARKVIHVEAKKESRRRIVRELHIMHECRSEYIVTFYGAFLNEHNDVIMCMEYMDVGSLDRVSHDFGPMRIDVLGKVAEATLKGLYYLHAKHNIMHRDIKPSNILINSNGQFKLCDFGVSGELVNSIADTFVGTSTYMAPERIQGEKYTVKSDIWSFGLSIMELAIGKFPFSSNTEVEDEDEAGAPAGILDLLQQIVHEPAPRLPKSSALPPILDEMCQKCLLKDPVERPTPQKLLEEDPFVQAGIVTPVDLRAWAVGLMEKDNRKSHLAPQASPSTGELLRSHSPNIDSNPAYTPTSGEIPIVGHLQSPREYMTARSPTRSSQRSGGRPAGAHPGMGQRSSTSNSIPKYEQSLPSTTTASGPKMSLPVRPAPSGGSPAPPRKSTPDDLRGRRQAGYGYASNGSYGGGVGYPSK